MRLAPSALCLIALSTGIIACRDNPTSPALPALTIAGNIQQARPASEATAKVGAISTAKAPKPPASPSSPTSAALLSCTNEEIVANATVTISGSGGSGSYNWSAPGGTPASGSGTASFSTQYAEVGEHIVTVSVGTSSATCIVTVLQPLPPE